MNYSDQFITALEAGDLAKLQMVPKTDLHNHASLGGTREYINQRLGCHIPPLLEPLKDGDAMHAWNKQYIGSIFKDATYTPIALEACFHQAQVDGVVVLEVGEDVWGNGALFGGDMDRLIDTYTQQHRTYAPGVDFRFQVGLSRHCPIHLLEEWMAPFLERDCFFSIDLYCDELAQPITNFKGLYRQAKDKGWLLKAHVGEFGTAEDVQEAVEELELAEVQHGIAAASSPSIMRWLADHHIQLNITPTSNVMLSRVESLRVHPIRTLYDAGIRVTINSDDILMFGQGVSDEYLNLFHAGVFTAEELDTIRLYGLESRGIYEDCINLERRCLSDPSMRRRRKDIQATGQKIANKYPRAMQVLGGRGDKGPEYENIERLQSSCRPETES